MAVVGAGASGVLLAAHYRHATPSGRLALIDAGARAARGLAYGTPYGAHLLNVPAARMSAFDGDPGHFLRWLQKRVPDVDGRTFAPRKLFGDYLHEVLQESGADRVGGTAVGVTRVDDRWSVHLHDGRIITARSLVLALGNLPPADPLRLGPEVPAAYLRDPWAPGAAVGLDREASVLMIGSGLTMVDLALALRQEGHRGVIHAISRSGRLPQAHAPQPLPALEVSPETATPAKALRWIRAQYGRGWDWQQVIDAMRPHTTAIWQRWTLAQRGTFLRHGRNLWDVHRHRMAPEVAAAVEELQRQKVLHVHRGRIVALSGDIDVRWRPFGSDRDDVMRVARVINCTGPATDYERVDLPLAMQMRRAGWLVPDKLRLGVETDADGMLIGAGGKPVKGLYTMGPLRRPSLWESTAIPDIRTQAAALASKLVAGSW